MDELTTFQDWLKQMVDGEAITQVYHCTIASTTAQELGTLLNSLKEGVKTITAITKYEIMKILLLPMLTNLYWW